MGQVTTLETPHGYNQTEDEMKVMGEDTLPDDAVVSDDSEYFDCETYPQAEMDGDMEHVDRILTGMGELLSQEELGGQLTGNEKYALSVLRLHGYDGNEGLRDDLKKAGEAAYKSVVEILAKVKAYFKGEGKEQKEAAEAKAKSGIEILAKGDKAKPVNENSKAIDAQSFKNKLLVKGADSVIASDSSLKSKFDHLITSISRLEQCKTVGNVGAVYQLITSEASKLADEVSRGAERFISEAENKAKQLRSPKNISETSDREAQSAAKGEQKATTDETKQAAALARGRAVVSRALNNLMGAIGTNATALAGAKVDSNFKG